MSEVVLVHGAWHGPWCWDGVVAELRRLGVTGPAAQPAQSPVPAAPAARQSSPTWPSAPQTARPLASRAYPGPAEPKPCRA